VLELFFENGQNVNAIDNNGRSILMKFVLFEQKEPVWYLLYNTAIDLSLKMKREVDGDSVLAGESAIDIARNKLSSLQRNKLSSLQVNPFAEANRAWESLEGDFDRRNNMNAIIVLLEKAEKRIVLKRQAQIEEDNKVISLSLISHAEEEGKRIKAEKEKLEKLQNEVNSDCCICEEKKKEYACIPCGHRCLCEDCCNLDIDVCPLCREAIKSISKIFL
jgi:hypothetical protein